MAFILSVPTEHELRQEILTLAYNLLRTIRFRDCQYAILDYKSIGGDMNYEFTNGARFLSQSILCGRIASMKILIENGADINQKSCGRTPLSTAVEQNEYEAAKFLLERGVDDSVEIQYFESVEVDEEERVGIDKKVCVELYDLIDYCKKMGYTEMANLIINYRAMKNTDHKFAGNKK